MKRHRILLVDDHPLIRTGLKSVIEGRADLEVSGEASNGREALQQTKLLLPDIICLDISMPGGGPDIVQQMKAIHPKGRILVLTVHDETYRVQQMLQAGASGYMLKNTADMELLRAISIILDDLTYLDPNLTSGLVNRYVRTNPNEAPSAELTPREEEIARLTAWGYINKEIADRLGISVKTVETHRAHLYRKLGLQSRADIVRYAVQQGWLDKDGAI